MIKEVANPDGRLRNRDRNADRPGRVYSAAGSVHHGLRHGMDPREMPIDAVADAFARKVAAILEDGRARSLFRDLVVVAEPRFFGKLRSAMTRRTAQMVVATIDKELNSFRGRELERRLSDVLLAS